MRPRSSVAGNTMIELSRPGGCGSRSETTANAVRSAEADRNGGVGRRSAEVDFVTHSHPAAVLSRDRVAVGRAANRGWRRESGLDVEPLGRERVDGDG